LQDSLLYRYLKLRYKARINIRFLAFILGYDELAKHWAFFHSQGINLLNENRFVMLLIPRGWFKTTLFTITRGVQRIINNPNIRRLIISYTGINARAMLSEVGNHFLLNENLRFLFPDICPKNQERPETGSWNQDGFTINRTQFWKEATCEALGADQTPTSRHYDDIDIDDLVVYANTRTADQIKKTIEFMHIVPPLLNNHRPDSQLYFIGNHWVPDDVYVQIREGKLLAPDGKVYKSYVIDSEYEEGGIRKATWVSLFPLEKLDGLKAADSITHSAQYRNDPIDIENAVWRKDMIQYYVDLPVDLDLVLYGAVDPSISETDLKTNSDSAVGVLGIDPKNEFWVIDYKVGRGMNDVYDFIFDLYIKWRLVKNGPKGMLKFRLFGIETILFQKLVQKELQRLMREKNIWIPTKEFKPITNKIERIIGAFDGRIRNKGFHIKVGMTELETQIIRIGRPGTKLDILDMLAQAAHVAMVRPKKEVKKYEPVDYSHMLGSIAQ
jgi:hypothetical protein